MAENAAGASATTSSSDKKAYNVFPKPGVRCKDEGLLFTLKTVGGSGDNLVAVNNSTEPYWWAVLADKDQHSKLLAHPGIDRIEERIEGETELVDEKMDWLVMPTDPENRDLIGETEKFLETLSGSAPKAAYLDGELQYWEVSMTLVQSGKVGGHPGVDDIDVA